MPIKKQKGETKEQFISRCVPIEIEAGFENNQAVAMCYNYWTTENLADVRRIRRKNLKSLDTENFKIINGNTRTRNNTIKSSNVWKFKWNDKTGDLVVKFQDGSVYTYSGVTENDFESFRTGSGGTCETDGSSTVGGATYTWEIGKNPSVGAAVWDVIVRKYGKGSQGGSI